MNPVYKIIAVRTAQVSAAGMLGHWLLHWPLTGSFALGLFLTPALCLYFVFVFVGPLTWGLPVLTRLPGSEGHVALTFDDGPSEDATPRILDTLKAEGAHATFFVLGEAVRRHPELLRRIAAEGHAIGIHANKHQPFVLMDWHAINREIRQTEAAIDAACPEAVLVRWVRPPYGFKSLSLILALRRAGYGLAAWSVNSRDYRQQDPERIAAQAAAGAKAGAIILLHDGPGRAATAEALPLLLRELAKRGFAAAALQNGVSSLETND